MTETVKDVDIIETLEPSATTYTVVLAEGTDDELVLYQKPLSFFGKIELFSVLGNAVEKALAGGTTVADLLETPQGATVDAFGEADAFIKAIAKIAQVAPELIGDIYCISLGVKRGDRDFVKELLYDLDDKTGSEIEKRFLVQNMEAIMDFFVQQKSLVLEVSEKMQSKSTSSKPSKATQTPTQKQ